MKSRRLALLVAIALSGGGFLSSVQNVSAADVTGRNVTIDDTHAHSDNAIHPGGGPSIGTAAGFIQDEHDNGNVTNNTLTFKNRHYTNRLYGGLTFGKGNVTGNKVFVNSATSPLVSTADSIYGGSANGGGNVKDNHATFNGNQLNGDLVGGMATDGGTGTVKENTATLKGGNVHGSIYGGTTGNQANGDVLENEVLIEGGTVTGTGNVYGGYSDGDGNVKGNIVTIKGGVLNGIYGGYSSGTGEVSGNTVNLGDGTSAMAAGYAINGKLLGGKNTTDANKVSNNTLNVNTNAKAYNIENFSTINFNFSTHTDTNQALLELTDTNKTKLDSLSQLYVKNAKVGKGTLMWNSNGIEITDPTKVGRTEETTETIIEKNSNNKAINYRTYQFKDSTTTDFEGTNIWGGRSTIGNTTTGNKVTVSGNHSGKYAYGGWTSGTGSTATGENAQNHSIGNKITLEGAASEVYHMTGGFTDVAGGKATGNHAILTDGKVGGNLAGGSARDGEVSGNNVEINGGRVDGTTHGGITGGTGTAKNNKVTLTNGTVHSDIYGGVAASGNAEGNIVNIKGGSAANHDVYGGFSTNGNATGNTVTVTAGSVRNIDGGRTGSGNATGNTVNIGDGQAAYTGSISGNINGGNSSGGGRDYTTGNTLNVYGNALAANISNFAEINFRFNEYVNKNATFLTLTDGNGTNLRSLSDLKLHGTHNHKGTLIQAASAITVTDGQNRVARTEGDTKELVLAKSSDSKKITYESYIFKGATTPTTDDGGTYKDIFGGRSILGNTTTENTITVSDAVTYRNAYGGWTSGTGSDAPADKQKNSTLNKIKVSGAANVTGKVYGGFTDVAGGNATGNEVTIEKTIAADVIGGEALGEASGNTVTVGNVTVNSITGGDGATTKDNTVNIDGTTVTSKIVGGTQANGTNNTLNVKGENSAQSVDGFQKMNFNTNGVAAGGTMLNVTGGTQTKVNWNTLTADGNGRNISLLKNNNGIDFGSTYTDGDVKSGLSADKKSETNVSVTADKKEIKYTGYQFTGVTTTTIDGGNLYGGISKAGNSTRENKITVDSGSHTNVYGGHTSGSGTGEADKNNSHDNTVTITGGTVTGKLYGGYTDAADGKTYNNTVNLNGGNLSHAEISGGNRTIGTEKGNTLNVNTATTVKKIDNFQTVAFKDTSSKLTLTGAGVKFDLASVNAGFDAAAQEQTLVESSNALELADGNAFRSDLSADGTKETNVAARDNNKKIVRYGYTLKNATTATTVGSDTWGGRSAAGNTTTDNALTLTAGAHTNVYGGWTSGTGSKAAADQRGDSTKNRVTVKGAATVSGTVYGGYTDVMGGKATGNTVTVEKTINADIIGGKAAAEASGNTVNVTNAAVKSITGGFGTVTNYNRINLRDAKVTGMVTGGTAANGTGNALNVFYGTKTTEIGDYKGIRNLHFDMEKAPMDGTAHTMLRLTNVGGAKALSHTHIDLHRDGAAPKLQQGDKITLMENAGGDITVGENLTAKGTDGVTRNYEFALATVGKTLIATVTKTGLSEQAKSFVETRAGASAFLNDGGDYLAGSGMEAAKKEAHAAAQAGSGAYGLWAGMGGGALRHETGSYVDMKGWNLGVGWARENAVKEGTLTFGPFIEYGRGSYDSYLDDGTHGNGKTSYLGAGVMAKLETKANNWIDGSLRVGRTKSDYTGLDTGYDTTSTYYAMHVGVGKDFHVREGDTVSAYVRYSYAHTAGTSAHLSSGETLDFDAVNSHRLRIGTRYTHGATTLSQFYAGLAWEYEFDGDARATSQGDSAPSPSLKGSSALLELGYRFAPKADSRMSYDLNLTGWQGKRQGITGGLSVKWAF